ncbi:MAG TPA: alginate lyase family protein [Bacteroidales bacterium]|nr:alginate lyase family protein [Bacteroidales bacterium]
MKSSYPYVGWFALFTFIMFSSQVEAQVNLKEKIIENVRKQTIQKADSFLNLSPLTVTASYCSRSAGGLHDFYSEADYFWPDPQNPSGPYIQKDGQSYPGLFKEHRLAMIRFSEITASLSSAWLLTDKPEYARKALEHIKAWFVDTTTLMNPHMLYAQAIIGKNTGRGIGIIDAYHLVEVIQSIKQLSAGGAIKEDDLKKINNWFAQFLTWLTTHPYGMDEKNTKNNHSTCWIVTVSSISTLINDKEVTRQCTERFKNVLLPNQMAEDGSFPLEIRRTKPYGYSLFNIDAFCNAAQILSTPDDNLWEYATADGKSLQKGMEYIYPFIINKESWPFAKDIFIWEEWPVRQSSLLFAGLAYNNLSYIETLLSLPGEPYHPEVIRNLPVRHPVIWLMDFNRNR